MFDEFKNAFQRPNNAHAQLIIINVVVFLGIVVVSVVSTWTGMEPVFGFVQKIFLIPPRFSDFLSRPWTIITYSFAHDWHGVWHIFSNMIVLYLFGKLFIEYLGNDKLIAVYVLGALAGAALYLAMFNTIPFYINSSSVPGMVGASAAVLAIMVAISTLMPDYTFYVILLGPVRIKYIALFFIVVSFIGTIGPNEGGNIAHLGGALIGYVYTKQLQVGVNWGSWITSTLDWFVGLFKPSPKVKVTYRKTETKKTPTNFNKATQDEIDLILDKISDRGYESLTKEEKEKLFNASKK